MVHLSLIISGFGFSDGPHDSETNAEKLRPARLTMKEYESQVAFL